MTIIWVVNLGSPPNNQKGGTMKPELLLKVDRKTKRMTEAERWRLFVKRYCELYLKKVMNPY